MTTLAAGSIFWIVVLYSLNRLAEKGVETGMEGYCRLECGEFGKRTGKTVKYDSGYPMLDAVGNVAHTRLGGGIHV